MDRVILHSDINACYASVELLYDPKLRGKPLAVCGQQERRHGIVLAKDELAKRAGVKTGMTVWQAQRLCPGLQIVPPHFERYEASARQVRAIYSQYTDRCEPFGLDESWLDLTGCLLHADGPAAAREIKDRVRRETGLTVSIGVSWNKVLAKLGSDYKKPDAVTVINRENFRSLVWPLPAADLLMVGKRSAEELRRLGIATIGELARADPGLLHRCLGKMGPVLHDWANGRDDSPVRPVEEWGPAKSIGNSTTTPQDLRCDQEVQRCFQALAASVGRRLRAAGLRGGTVEISLRSENLIWRSHRARLLHPTDSTRELLDTAMALFHQCHSWPAPLHSLGLRVSELVSAQAPEQLDLFTDYGQLRQERQLDRAIDGIQAKYGSASLRRGLMS